MLTETPPESKSRVEQEAQKISLVLISDIVKVLIDNAILAIDDWCFTATFVHMVG